MTSIRTWADLRAATIDDLERRQEEMARQPSSEDLVNELRFRLLERSAEMQTEIAQQVRDMTKTIKRLTVAAVVIAAFALASSVTAIVVAARADDCSACVSVDEP